MKILKILLFVAVMQMVNTAYGADIISIIGVGDITLGTGYPSPDIPENNGKDLLKNVNHLLSNADVTFGNLEGPVLDQGQPAKKCSNPDRCYVFRMPEKVVRQVLTEAGFDVLSVANNHVGDFGEAGRDNTVKILKSLGIHAAGLVSIPHTTFEKNGVKFGFAAFAPNMGTVDLRDIAQAKVIVRNLKKVNDIVIVSFHGGAEGAQYQQVTRKTETFYGENRGNVYEFAHAVVDAGADVVFGHGPHVTRAVEVYQNRFIAYSLGNFCTYGPFELTGPKGVAPIMQINIDKQGRFINGQIIPIKQIKRVGVFIDSDKTVIDVIRNLTKTDFPETAVKIDKNGAITIP